MQTPQERESAGKRVPGSVIEDTQHGHNAIGVAIGPSDVAADRPDVVDG